MFTYHMGTIFHLHDWFIDWLGYTGALPPLKKERKTFQRFISALDVPRTVQSASQALNTADLNCSGSKFEVLEESIIYDPCRQFFWTVGFALFAPKKVYWAPSVGKWRLFGSASCTAEVLTIYNDRFSGVLWKFVQNVCLNRVKFSSMNRTG